MSDWKTDEHVCYQAILDDAEDYFNNEHREPPKRDDERDERQRELMRRAYRQTMEMVRYGAH